MTIFDNFFFLERLPIILDMMTL